MISLSETNHLKLLNQHLQTDTIFIPKNINLKGTFSSVSLVI